MVVFPRRDPSGARTAPSPPPRRACFVIDFSVSVACRCLVYGDVARCTRGVKRRRCRRDAIVKRSNAGFNCVKLFTTGDASESMGVRFGGT